MIKDILVHIPTERPQRPVIDASISLAASFHAQLDAMATGYIRPGLAYAADAAAAMDVAAVFEREQQQATERSAAALAVFETDARKAKIPYGCRSIQDLPAEAASAVGAAARLYDLAVVLRPDSAQSSFDNATSTEILLQAGGPVLFVPHIFAGILNPKRIGICWDGSRFAIGMNTIDSAPAASRRSRKSGSVKLAKWRSAWRLAPSVRPMICWRAIPITRVRKIGNGPDDGSDTDHARLAIALLSFGQSGVSGLRGVAAARLAPHLFLFVDHRCGPVEADQRLIGYDAGYCLPVKSRVQRRIKGMKRLLMITGVATAALTSSVASAQSVDLTGTYTCVQRCQGDMLAYVTQNGRELNLTTEAGVASRAWPDWFSPASRIWIDNYNISAVYTPDGMTIQFDNGTIWHRYVPQPLPQPRRRAR